MEPAPRTLKNYTLQEFCRRCFRFIQNENFSDFVQFALTGIHENEQAMIDIHQNVVTRGGMNLLRATRDYDSVLGISADILLSKNLAIYILPNFKESLSKNIHIKYSFTNDNGNFNVPVHTIPNICIGKWMLRNSLRILFLDLYSNDRKTHYVFKEECAEFYEKGIRPALVALLPGRTSDLPATLEQEMFRSKDLSGHIAFSSRMLLDYAISQFAEYLRYYLELNKVSWGKNIAFLHEIRGVKNTTFHTPSAVAADQALEQFLEDNSIDFMDSIGEEDWYVDVGLEIASEDKNCLGWRTDAHNLIVHDLGGLPFNQADRITKPGSSQYYRDLTSHLTGVSGFRIAPGRNGRGIYDIHYMQAYTTDKALTYRPDGTHSGKYLTVKQILHKKADQYLEDLYKLYLNSARDNYACARVEVRVPISNATKVFTDVFEQSLGRYLVSFPRQAWWGFRAYCTLAFKYILEWQFSGPLGGMGRRPALLLTAAAPWFLNSLHSAPDTGPSSRELMEAILPHVSAEEANPEHLPYRIPLPNAQNRDDTPEEEVEHPDDRHSLERQFDMVEEEDRALFRQPPTRGSEDEVSEDEVSEDEVSRMIKARKSDGEIEMMDIDDEIEMMDIDDETEVEPPAPRRRLDLRTPLSSDNEDEVEPSPPWRRLKERRLPLRSEEEEESEPEELGPIIAEEIGREDSDEDIRATIERRHRRTTDTVPYIPYGAIFLRPICVGRKYPVPRFREGPWISKKAVQYLFGMDIDAVVERFNPPLISFPRHPQRVKNRVMHRHIGMENVPHVFDLQSQGHSLVPRPRDEGSDLEDSDTDDSCDDGDGPRGLNDTLDRILASFWIDILQVSPNRKSATESSYLVDALDAKARRKATLTIYQNQNLAETFNNCFWFSHVG